MINKTITDIVALIAGLSLVYFGFTCVFMNKNLPGPVFSPKDYVFKGGLAKFLGIIYLLLGILLLTIFVADVINFIKPLI